MTTSEAGQATTGNTPATGEGASGTPAAVTESAKPAEGATASASQQSATEGQPAAAKTGETASDKGEGAKTEQPAGAPEKYEFKAPEGTTLDEKLTAEFSAIAKTLNLPQDAAQQAIDKLLPMMNQRQQAALDAAKEQWRADAKADKEFGGNKLDENLAVAKKALDAFGTPELRKLLDESGLGNHPELIRAFFRAGKSISEDRFVPGGTQPPKVNGARDPARALYPNQPN